MTIVETLKDITEVLPVVAVISAVALFITAKINRQQLKVSQQKLKLDLFEKRLEAYQSIQDYLFEVLQEYEINNANIQKLNYIADKYYFLFGSDIDKWIQEVIEKSKYANKLRLRLKDLNPGSERSQLVKEHGDLLDWHIEQMKKSKTLYSKYMKIEYF